MQDTINALRDTPIPTVLIWAGLLFILLACVSKLGGIIEVPPDRSGSAMFVGIFLLTIGLVLDLAPISQPAISNKPKITTEQTPALSSSPTNSPVEKLLTNSALIQESPTPTSSPTPTNTYKEKYKNREYPMRSCGKVTGSPVYPIFISRRSNNLEGVYERVKEGFCQDATDPKEDVLRRIQVASFSDEKEADMFVEFMREQLEGEQVDVKKGQAQ